MMDYYKVGETLTFGGEQYVVAVTVDGCAGCDLFGSRMHGCRVFAGSIVDGKMLCCRATQRPDIESVRLLSVNTVLEDL